VKSDHAALLRVVDENRFSCLLVCDGSIDKAVGIVHAKNLLPIALRGDVVELRALMTPALIIPEAKPVLKLLEQFKRDRVHMAIIVDEYGTTEGLVTLTDVLESIAGELPKRGEEIGPLIVQREDGSWLVDGMLPLDEFEDRVGLRDLQGEGHFTQSPASSSNIWDICRKLARALSIGTRALRLSISTGDASIRCSYSSNGTSSTRMLEENNARSACSASSNPLRFTEGDESCFEHQRLVRPVRRH
jgi:hypothetical protein